MVGTSLKYYRITAKLGEGGMGEVYRATDTKLGREVAIKVLPASIERDPHSLARFEREAKALAALNHPHIAGIHDFDAERGTHFLVMELVEGETLAERLRQGPLPIQETLAVARQMAEAIQEAHEKGIIHRDLKPGNVKITPSGRVKILDFGLAKMTQTFHGEAASGTPPSAEAATLPVDSTRPGAVMGTPAYMSPEQARGLEVDKRTDIWAFGCCLFECLSGRKPFRGRTASDLMAEVLKSEPDWSQIPPETPHAVVTLLRRCLEKEPSRRLSAIGDIAIMLDESTRGPTAAASPPMPQPPSAPTPAALLTAASARRLGPLAAGLLVLLVGAGIFFWNRPGASHPAQTTSERVKSNTGPVSRSGAVAVPAPDQKSVAVLAFANLSEDKGNDYFSDGLSEELLNVLSKVPGLKVSARTSAFHFKGKDTPIPEIAKQLDVAYVVEGSVRKSGNRVRITSQLIKAADGFHVWSDNFDRELKDIFAVQDEIAGLIAHHLSFQLRLGAEGGPVIPHSGTENLEAYDLFLRGRQLWNKRTGADLERAIGYFQQATEKDPKFAQAYAGLGLCYVLLPAYKDVSQKEAYPKARAAAQRALELDPRSAEAQTALGLCSAGECDAIGAETAYRQALVYNPNYATAHQWYGEFLANYGRTEQAVAEARKALALDPLSPVIQCDAGEALWYGRRYDEALLQIDKALQLSPDYPLAYTYRGMVKLIQKRYAEAITDLEKAHKLERARIDNRAFLGHCYGAMGRTNEAMQAIEELKTVAAKGIPVATYIALVYKGLGDKEQVFAWLERAAPDPNTGVRTLKYDPMWDEVTADPRYSALLEKHGLDK